MNGKIKTIAIDRETGNRKGFGFIEPDGGSAEAFFHHSAVVGCRFQDLQEGDAVTFDLGSGPKGPRAENVRRR